MKADLEGDFWKDIFVHMQHKNMMRSNVERMTVENAESSFLAFQKEFPEVKTEITNTSSSITWEAFVTPTVKLRLFIQHQIKGSLLKVEKGDLVKIADAKFPYNPFPEVCEMMKNRGNYENALEGLKQEQLYNNRQLKIAKEFACALVEKKLSTRKDGDKTIWSVDITEDGLLLKIKTGSEEKEYPLTAASLLDELKAI